MQTRQRLALKDGAFTVLMADDHVTTTYSDYGGTSRSSVCAPFDLVAFAMAVLERYVSDGQVKIGR